MHQSFLRTLVVCGACVHVAGSLGAEAAAFPLLITAMTAQVGGRAELIRVATQLLAHLVSAAAAAFVSLWLPDTFTGGLRHGAVVTTSSGTREGFWSGLAMATSGPGDAHLAFLAGCLLLLSLQFTRLRHPPALASGGAVLCGIDPIAVMACVAITGGVLAAEPLVIRLRRLARW